MPGRKPSDASWRWTSPLKALRQVTAADANLAAVTETINMSRPENQDGGELQTGYDNILHLGLLFPAAVTSVTVEVFVESTPSDNETATGWTPLSGDQYALIHDETITESGMITLQNIFASEVKVMISALAGSGTVSVVYARSE